MEIKPLFFKNYISVIEKSVGTEMFKNIYAEVGGEEKDILENGNLSCAFFVSSLLKIFDLIKNLHATVDGTVRDLDESGWFKIDEPKIGAILVWEKVDFGKEDMHKHIGFYIGEEKAVSNDSKSRKIIIHNFTFDSQRKIEKIFFHQKLE